MSQLHSFSGGMSAALVSPIQIYLLFPFYLKNEAKLWYELNFSDKKIPTSDEEALVEWKKLIEEFKKKYNDLSRNESKRVTIKRRMQGDDENLIDYIKDMIDLGKGLDKKIIFDHCIVGMKVDYYKKVNEKQIKTLEELLDSALVIQNDMEFDEKEDREKFERLKCYSNNPVNLNHQAHLFNVNYGQRKYNTFYKNINTDQQNQKHQPRVRCFNQGRKYNNPNWSLKLPQNDVFSNLANLSNSTSVEILSSMRFKWCLKVRIQIRVMIGWYKSIIYYIRDNKFILNKDVKNDYSYNNKLKESYDINEDSIREKDKPDLVPFKVSKSLNSNNIKRANKVASKVDILVKRLYKDETLNPWKNRYKDNLILNDPLFK
ncbi:hypothetical protein BLOT_003266 [Blomia tropicalis]|nr:hypothetical protein BLOT_003266 [Blomia tropicalis]